LARLRGRSLYSFTYIAGRLLAKAIDSGALSHEKTLLRIRKDRREKKTDFAAFYREAVQHWLILNPSFHHQLKMIRIDKSERGIFRRSLSEPKSPKAKERLIVGAIVIADAIEQAETNGPQPEAIKNNGAAAKDTSNWLKPNDAFKMLGINECDAKQRSKIMARIRKWAREILTVEKCGNHFKFEPNGWKAVAKLVSNSSNPRSFDPSPDDIKAAKSKINAENLNAKQGLIRRPIRQKSAKSAF
jgi:hypothetical protein